MLGYSSQRQRKSLGSWWIDVIFVDRIINQLVWSELLITNIQISDVTCRFSPTYYVVATCFTFSSYILFVVPTNLLFQIQVSEHVHTISLLSFLHIAERVLSFLWHALCFSSLENFCNRMCTFSTTESSLRGNLWKTTPYAFWVPML